MQKTENNKNGTVIYNIPTHTYPGSDRKPTRLTRWKLKKAIGRNYS